MIDSLTPEQIAKFPEYVNKWIEIGLRGGDCDLEACKEIIPEIYKEAGLKPPSKYIVADSPIDGIKKAKEIFGTKYRESELLLHQVYGLHDSAWLSLIDFYYNELDLDFCSKLTPLMKLAEVCGWWAPYSDVVIVQHRPKVYLEDGILHNDSGAAIYYKDGYSVWAIRCVVVDSQIVMSPETQTIEQIQSEVNEEVKRVRIERYGWEKFLKGVNAVVIDSRLNDIDQTLESLMACEDMKILVCACSSTAKVFCLEVPPEITMCEEAQRWMGPSSGFCLGST